MIRSIVIFALILSGLFSCTKSQEQASKPFTAAYNIFDLPTDSNFAPAKIEGHLQNKELVEASGLVSGIKNKHILYSINDSGNQNELFLLKDDGTNVGAYFVDKCPDRDWEDIAVGPGPKPDVSYLFIPDIGDNDFKWPAVFVYRMEEPDIPATQPFQEHIKDAEQFTLKYPDGPHNAETFLVDPETKDWYIITKENRCKVYVARYPQNTSDTIMLQKLGVLPFSILTAGDISQDGMNLLVKDYGNIYYWKRKPGETIAQLLQRAPAKVPYLSEPQGESIAWASDDSGYYTTSEQTSDTLVPALYFYKRQ